MMPECMIIDSMLLWHAGTSQAKMFYLRNRQHFPNNGSRLEIIICRSCHMVVDLIPCSEGKDLLDLLVPPVFIHFKLLFIFFELANCY